MSFEEHIAKVAALTAECNKRYDELARVEAEYHAARKAASEAKDALYIFTQDCVDKASA